LFEHFELAATAAFNLDLADKAGALKQQPTAVATKVVKKF